MTLEGKRGKPKIRVVYKLPDGRILDSRQAAIYRYKHPQSQLTRLETTEEGYLELIRHNATAVGDSGEHPAVSADQPSSVHSGNNGSGVVGGSDRTVSHPVTDGDNLGSAEKEVSTGNVDIPAPEGQLEVMVSEESHLPEAEELANSFRNMSFMSESAQPEEEYQATEADYVDVELLGTTIVDVTDLAVERVSRYPLTKKEREKGNHVVGRVLEKRIKWLLEFGDIVNVVLWILEVTFRRLLWWRHAPLTAEEMRQRRLTQEHAQEFSEKAGEKQNQGSGQGQGQEQEQNKGGENNEQA